MYGPQKVMACKTESRYSSKYTANTVCVYIIHSFVIVLIWNCCWM